MSDSLIDPNHKNHHLIEINRQLIDSFREKLSSEGISKESDSLTTSARRKGTNSHHELSRRKWNSWYYSRQVDPIRCTLKYT